MPEVLYELDVLVFADAGTQNDGNGQPRVICPVDRHFGEECFEGILIENKIPRRVTKSV